VSYSQWNVLISADLKALKSPVLIVPGVSGLSTPGLPSKDQQSPFTRNFGSGTQKVNLETEFPLLSSRISRSEIGCIAPVANTHSRAPRPWAVFGPLREKLPLCLPRPKLPDLAWHRPELPLESRRRHQTGPPIEESCTNSPGDFFFRCWTSLSRKLVCRIMPSCLPTEELNGSCSQVAA
jgi:hypothetical protein